MIQLQYLKVFQNCHTYHVSWGEGGVRSTLVARWTAGQQVERLNLVIHDS